MRWDVILSYMRAVRSVRAGRPEPSRSGAVEFSHEQIAAYRQAVTHLDSRLPSDAETEAAFGGLQDSAPRSGLLGLHARMEAVGPGSWDHPDLAQIWFRWADYIVPRSGLGDFTLGASPRDPDIRAALDEFASAVLEVCSGRTLSTREVSEAFTEMSIGTMMRCLSVTGRLHIRWDASFSGVVPAEPAGVDPEEARRGLARRFLRWYGPADVTQFARWAGIPKPDAELTWSHLGTELVPVAVGGTERFVLEADLDQIRAKQPAGTVRLLPMGDSYLQLDQGPVVPLPPGHLGQAYLDDGGKKSVVNSLGGRVLIEGRIVGSWGRKAAKLTIAPWRELSRSQEERLAEEVQLLVGPLGAVPTVAWLR